MHSALPLSQSRSWLRTFHQTLLELITDILSYIQICSWQGTRKTSGLANLNLNRRFKGVPLHPKSLKLVSSTITWAEQNKSTPASSELYVLICLYFLEIFIVVFGLRNLDNVQSLEMKTFYAISPSYGISGQILYGLEI